MTAVAQDSESGCRCSQFTHDPALAGRMPSTPRRDGRSPRRCDLRRRPCLISARLTASRPTLRVRAHTDLAGTMHDRPSAGVAEHRWRTSRCLCRLGIIGDEALVLP
jgi:hypothetical protein